MCLRLERKLFYSQPVMNPPLASHTASLSTTLTRRSFSAAVLQRRRGSAFQLLGNRHSISRRSGCSPLGDLSLQGAKMGFVQAHMPNATADITQPAAGGQCERSPTFAHTFEQRSRIMLQFPPAMGACNALRGLKSSSSSREKRFQGRSADNHRTTVNTVAD